MADLLWAVVCAALAVVVTSLALIKRYVLPHSNDLTMFKVILQVTLAKNEQFWDVVAKGTGKNPLKVAMINAETGVETTFAELTSRSDQVANWAASTSLKPGDTVALLSNSEPEFVIWWLGLLKAGLRVAFLQLHLEVPSLTHCVGSAQSHALIALASTDGVTDVLGRAEKVASLLRGEPSTKDLLFFTYGGKAEGSVHVDESCLSSADVITNRPPMPEYPLYLFTR